MEAAAYDLIAAGAGPAGCACAITAARAGARVLLLEKDSFPRHKVCGEFVSPESLDLLASLLCGDQFSLSPQISGARLFSNGKVASLPVSPAARSISRFELDHALLQAARGAGVDARERVTVTEVKGSGPFRVITSAGEFSARAVVNATGRWSRLTQPVAPEDLPKWIGLKGHFREPSPPCSVDLYFFTGGYCGVQPVGENMINACAMVRADRARSLGEAFSLNPELARRARGWEPLWPAISTAALFFRPPKAQRHGVLLAGDAAAFIDPFAGDGISLALHTGTLSAACLVPFLQDKAGLETAAVNYEREYRRRFAPGLRNAGRIRRLLSAPPWISSRLLGLAAIGPIGKLIVRATRART